MGLGGALNLDELAAGVHGDVEVDFGAAVEGVVEVEAGLAVDDADTDGGDGTAAAQGIDVDESVAAGASEGVGEGNVGAGDGGGARAAIRGEDVAVASNCQAGHFGEIDSGAEDAADEALDFGGAAVGAALDALGAGARKHGVFGGDPAALGDLAARRREPGREFGGEGGGAKDARVALSDEPGGRHGERGAVCASAGTMGGKWLDDHGTQGSGGSTFGRGHG